MSFKLKAAIMAAVAAAAAPAFAAPDTTIYGGGATLPANAYVGNSWLVGDGVTIPSPANRLSNPADAGSLFGQYSASTAATQGTTIGFPAGSSTRPLVSYCQTGSGDGRRTLTGSVALLASGDCGTYGSGPTARKTDLTRGFSSIYADTHFSASDAPMSASDYNAYLTNKGAAHAEPVQMPAIAGAIAVVYNNVQTGTTIGAKPISLTESQVCQIFSGAINNWSQLGFPSKPIKLVIRSDDSGTSFSFSNHLSKVCSDSAIGTTVSGFSTQSTFKNAFPGGASGAPGLPGSTATVIGDDSSEAASTSGNGGVVTTVFATDGAIGYAEISDAVNRASIDPSHPNLQYAAIQRKGGINAATGKAYKSKSPLKIGKKFKLAAGAMLTDTVISSTPNALTGRPDKLTLASQSISVPRAGCMLTADPDAYATAGLDTNGDYITYPIMAVSYLLAHSGGNGDNALNLQQLFASVYGAPTLTNIMGTTTTIGQTKGYAYLAGFKNPTSAIKQCILP